MSIRLRNIRKRFGGFVALDDVSLDIGTGELVALLGRAGIDAEFSRACLAADVVISALDADVIKTYVELGLGVGIVASMAFDPERDRGLRRLDASHLFAANTTRIAVHQGRYLRGYAYRFIELCSPTLNEQTVREAIKPARDELAG